MATLTKKQVKSVEDFIKKLPDSIVKGNYEKWLTESREDGMVTDEEMSKFVSLAINLPVEFQSFPQGFQHQVNMANELTDTPEPIKSKTVTPEKKAEPKKDVSEVQKKEDKRIIAANKEVKESDKTDKKVIEKTVIKEAPKKK